jgi:hypothetical protein
MREIKERLIDRDNKIGPHAKPEKVFEGDAIQQPESKETAVVPGTISHRKIINHDRKGDADRQKYKTPPYNRGPTPREIDRGYNKEESDGCQEGECGGYSECS